MSFDDLGSSAWADTSPSASPKLENDDIWGNTRGTRIPDLSPGGFGAELTEEALELESRGREPQDVDETAEPAEISTRAELPELDTSQKQADIDNLQDKDDDFGEQLPDESGQESASLGFQQNNDDFDDDADFEFGDAPAAQTSAAGEFDDFGDFGEFDDAAQEGTSESAQPGEAGQNSFGNHAFMDEPEGIDEEVWEDPDRPLPAKALHLDARKLPSKTDIRSEINALLSPIYPILGPNPPFDIRTVLTDEPIRQVAGLGQILFSEESRDLYAQLITPPVLKPLDWTRSRVRREQLISLGVPVNLDEVDSHRLSALPPLRIGPNAEAGPGPRTSSAREKMGKNGKLKTEKLAGPRPEFNRERCGKLLSYREDQLSLVPPKYLSRMQEDLVQACSEAASLLAWLKEIKEVRGEENKRRNETIAGLIASAQKYKASEMSSGSLFRKGSVKRSGSGSQTPKRTSSPIIGR